ncbi:MAG: HAD family hydrolase [Pseudomonadota bacterium]
MTLPPTLPGALGSASALLFDFDGTLAPNLDLAGLRRRMTRYSERWRVPRALVEGAGIVEIVTLSGQWLKDNADTAHAARYQQAALALIRRFELRAAEKIDPFAATAPLLAAWRDRGGRSAIVTRNCRAAVLRTFPELLSLADALFARDDVPHLKPDPRHLEQATAALGLRPEHCLMIGDGCMDMEMGRAHGTLCIGVLSGSNDANALRQAGAHFVLERIDALLETLAEL